MMCDTYRIRNSFCIGTLCAREKSRVGLDKLSKFISFLATDMMVNGAGGPFPIPIWI